MREIRQLNSNQEKFGHLSNRFSDHDIQPELLVTPRELHVLAEIKAKLLIKLDVDGAAAFQITRHPICVRLLRHVLDQLASVSFATGFGARAQVDQVPRVVVAVAQHGFLDVVQLQQELVEEALAALARELVVQAPHAAADHRPESVHVFTRRHPVQQLDSGIA
jgi:hypothetical protein